MKNNCYTIVKKYYVPWHRFELQKTKRQTPRIFILHYFLSKMFLKGIFVAKRHQACYEKQISNKFFVSNCYKQKLDF